MAEQRVERRLSAVLVGDVAGFSRLMGADEEGTLARLNVHRREFLDPKKAEHSGRVVKRTGDGVLIEFASAVQARAIEWGERAVRLSPFDPAGFAGFQGIALGHLMRGRQCRGR
jgi:class 3 adenylate cyclase